MAVTCKIWYIGSIDSLYTVDFHTIQLVDKVGVNVPPKDRFIGLKQFRWFHCEEKNDHCNDNKYYCPNAVNVFIDHYIPNCNFIKFKPSVLKILHLSNCTMYSFPEVIVFKNVLGAAVNLQKLFLLHLNFSAIKPDFQQYILGECDCIQKELKVERTKKIFTKLEVFSCIDCEKCIECWILFKTMKSLKYFFSNSETFNSTYIHLPCCEALCIWDGSRILAVLKDGTYNKIRQLKVFGRYGCAKQCQSEFVEFLNKAPLEDILFTHYNVAWWQVFVNSNFIHSSNLVIVLKHMLVDPGDFDASVVIFKLLMQNLINSKLQNWMVIFKNVEVSGSAYELLNLLQKQYGNHCQYEESNSKCVFKNFHCGIVGYRRKYFWSFH